jgi:hypothetical protein
VAGTSTHYPPEGVGMVAPVLEKAPVLAMKSARAIIPSVLPRTVDRSMEREAFVRMSRCWLYLGHSLRMWFLDNGRLAQTTRETSFGPVWSSPPTLPLLSPLKPS